MNSSDQRSDQRNDLPAGLLQHHVLDRLFLWGVQIGQFLSCTIQDVMRRVVKSRKRRTLPPPRYRPNPLLRKARVHRGAHAACEEHKQRVRVQQANLPGGINAPTIPAREIPLITTEQGGNVPTVIAAAVATPDITHEAFPAVVDVQVDADVQLDMASARAVDSSPETASHVVTDFDLAVTNAITPDALPDDNTEQTTDEPAAVTGNIQPEIDDDDADATNEPSSLPSEESFSAPTEHADISSTPNPPEEREQCVDIGSEINTLLNQGISPDYLLAVLTAIGNDLPPLPSHSPYVTADGLVQLSAIWKVWFASLNSRQQSVLTALYGLDGDEPSTLQEIGDELELTRERVRQIREPALRKLRGRAEKMESAWHLSELFTSCLQGANNLLTAQEWERYLDKTTVWDAPDTRPALLRLLCDLFSGHDFNSRYQVARPSHVGAQLETLDKLTKAILRKHKDGLTPEALFDKIAASLSPSVPQEMREPAFLHKALSLFGSITHMPDGRYMLASQRRRLIKRTAPVVPWLGRPGTQLFEWEKKLRKRIEQVAWIGQIAFSEAEFTELCHTIQTEARAPNYFSKIREGQPRLVPAAVFITTMVFAARYSQQDADEFWVPYLASVWNVEYTQAFMARCRKRFASAVTELEQTYHLEFPRVSDGDIVAPIYRHALLPRYVQDDFAAWIRQKWRDILPLADTPSLLIPAIQQDTSLTYLPKRLQSFLLGKNSRATAANLIADMAAAISLHLNAGESTESIAARLADTPIEQELWAEIAQEFTARSNDVTPAQRRSKPRIQWVWDIESGELALRVQNIMIASEDVAQGEPDRLVWVKSIDDDLVQADIEVSITPWRMQTGERIIQEVLLAEPDGPLPGEIVLLTDEDKPSLTLEVPSLPAAPIQFFRPTQQNALGTPVAADEVTDGTWYVCAHAPVRIVERELEEGAEGEQVAPDRLLPVPYPLDATYTWAAQVTLTLPAAILAGDDDKALLQLEDRRTQDAPVTPILQGSETITGLAAPYQATYASRHITLTFAEGGERLSKQAALWLQEQDGWRWHSSFSTMLANGQAILVNDVLTVHLAKILPERPGGYVLDVRASLHSILPATVSFAVIPGLRVELPSQPPFYSPAHPFEIVLRGLTESDIVPRADIIVTPRADQSLHVTWNDLRHDPRLLLRFGKTEIPLEWSPPRATAWLEPTPLHAFLTLDELHDTTLHVVTKGLPVDGFSLSVNEGETRHYSLRRGHASLHIGQDQIHAMVRLAKQPHSAITIGIGQVAWKLCEVRQRPDLSRARVEYDASVIRLHTGLRHAWSGACLFLVESISNPFAQPEEVGRQERLQAQHVFAAALSPGSYRLVIELDGARLPLNEQASRFEVGEQRRESTPPDNGELEAAIRSGQPIPSDLAEDFVLLWAELAERGKVQLTPTTLFQLATIPALALENFQSHHLQRLWPILAALHGVQDEGAWFANHDLLPAWVLLPNPLIFRTISHGHEWPVYPIVAAHGGLTGKGYGIWPIAGSSVQVFVQWQMVSSTQVHVEAGIPDEPPEHWEDVDMLDIPSLYYCTTCGRLVGEKGRYTLSEEALQQHQHGQGSAELKQINVDEAYGGLRLIVECLDGRRGRSLLDVYEEYDVQYPAAHTYLPVPHEYLPAYSALTLRKLDAITTAAMRYGDSCVEGSPWANATRLLSHWQKVGSFGQAMVALGLLLRTAAYYPHRYRRMLQQSALNTVDVQKLLAELDQDARADLEWGITWAELLMLHSPGFASR